ncbi:MAG: hypothetical protein JWM11_154 [Planctomycetaceae bacterium]|nr:hypothetical protein [Planctomycetaceae bacterium]
MESLVLTKSSVDAKERRAARWTLIGCSIIVFLTSVCIMVLELTASRLIARAVGSSLYTWTSVIGVILAGISAGNFLGGWLADRYDHRKLLSWLFFISSFCCITIYPLAQLIGTTRPSWMSWPMWIVTVVSALFLHPSVALGTISPITASMALAKAKSTGSTVGNVYAWGAMGSILGTFLAGFFLISSVGTQNIIWLTAATLAILGVCVASGQMMFRGVMLFGWLQFVLWIGFLASAKQPELEAGEDVKWWHKVLGNAHKIGMELQLRKDDPDEYHVESDYFSVNVGLRRPESDSSSRVPVLILDHLVHSYFDPRNPTKLYYDYENIYAALTERAAESWKRKIDAALEKLPFDASKLPAGVKYDPATKLLTSQGAINEVQFRALLALSPQADYWHVIQELASTENSALFSGMAALPLEKLPEGVVIPTNLNKKINYDPNLGAITRYAKLSSHERDVLMALGPDKGFYQAAANLHQRSRQTSALFLGGGGFVFPRWIEAYFPYEPLIHVLELDPAVKLAVQKKMGLAPDDETYVKTLLGDARNSVDDLINGLDHDPRYPGKHNYYDFVYGDAFNDFSVPWHLTTKEFTEKIKELMTPDEGVFLINVIDILPRAEVPRKLSKSEVEDEKPQPGIEFVPSEMIPDNLQPETWAYAKAPFEDFEIQQLGDDSKTKSGKLPYLLGYRRRMTDEAREQLLKLAPENVEWQKSVAELASRTQNFKAGRFLGAYVNTVSQVFPNVYVFSADRGLPSDDRDTFVIACSLKKLNMDDLNKSGGHWSQPPFARLETASDGNRVISPQMNAILELARGVTLTDDFAPVDNLLVPVFSRQDD